MRQLFRNRLSSTIAGALAVAAAAFVAAPAHAQYVLQWGDEFNGPANTAPNPAYWMYQTGTNWGNGELDTGTNSTANGSLDGNGHLVLTEINNGGVYTSAHMSTQGLQYVGPYGQVEASEQIGYSQGIGEAFWAMGQDYITGGVPWPYCGEIDMLESHGGTTASEATSNGTIHGYDVNDNDNYGIIGYTMPYTNPGNVPLHNAYHTYGMYWFPFKIQFYVDGNIYSSPDVTQLDCNGTWPFNQPIFLIDSAGLGGQVAGAPNATTVMPMSIYTDYVHWNTLATGAPATPGTLTATPYSNGVQLNWGASSTPGVYYDIYENTTNSFTPGDLGTLVTYNETNTSLYVSSLKPNTTYYFNVVAANGGGESTPQEITVTTSAPGNSGPVYIHCGGYGVDKYMKDLTYNVNGNPNYHWPNTYNTSGVANAAPAPVYNTERWGPQTYKITNLNPNTLYTVRMHMVEVAKTGPGQREFNAYLNGYQVLSNFDVYAAAGAQFVPVVRDFTTLSDEQGTVNLDLAIGAVDDPTISGLEVFADTGANNLPAPPTNLTATGTSTTNTSLNWTASTTSGVTYNVYRANDSSFVSSLATLVASGVSGTSYTDTVPYPGMTYYYRVTAVNSNGQSNRSNVASATSLEAANNEVIAIDCGSSTAVAQFVADTGWGGPTYTSSTASTISTAGVANAAPEAVYQTERYGGAANPIQSFFYQIIGLTPGATYDIRLHNSENYWTTTGQREFNIALNGTQVATNFDIVAAAGGNLKAVVNDYNTVADSNGHITILFTPGAADLPTIKGIECFFVSNAAIPAPTGVAAAAGNGQVAVSWNSVGAATSYNLYRGTTSGGEGSTPYQTGLTSTSFDDTALTNGTTYYYTVAAVGAPGTSAQSVEVSGTPSGPPSPPAGLTASAGDALVGLSWTASGGATSYNIYRGTSAGGENTTPVATNVTGSSYTDTGLTNGTTYYYEIAAVSNSGTSAMSNEASATPLATALAAPSHLTATGGNAQVGLAWTGSLGATSYNIYRGTSAGGENSTPIATSTGTSYTDSTVSNGTTYYYTVAAVDSDTTSSPSNEASATPQVPIPAAPGGLSAVGQNTQVSLSWSASSGATSYNVYRGTTAGGENSTPIATITGTAYTDTGLTNGKAYYYKVAAVNAGGTSPLSTEASATPVPPPPAAPTGLTATAAGTQIGLSWSGSSGATSYNVYRATTSGGEGTTPIATSVTSTSYTDSGLSFGTTYYYTVAAVDSSGTSPQSTEASAATVSGIAIDCGGAAAAPFVADTDFTGGGTQVVTNTIDTSLLSGSIPPQTVLQSNRYGNVTYTIPNLTPAGTYNVTLYFAEEYWSTAGSRVFNVSINGTQVLTNFDIVAAAGTNFKAVQSSFTVAATGTGTITVGLTNVKDNALVNGIVVAAAAPSTSAPAAPTGLTASAGNAQVSLAWTGSTGATSYNVYRGTSPGGESSTPVATGVAATLYTDTGLTNGTKYYYTVEAVNSIGTSTASNEASATPVQPVPAAPTGLTATPGNTTATLSWTAGSGATSYNIYRGTSAGGENSTPVGTATGTTYADSGLTDGATYFYKVAAVNGSGTSANSNEASASPWAPASFAGLSIDCGGGASGNFIADAFYTGGGSDTWGSTIDTSLLTGTVPPQNVLQSDREGGFTYTIPNLVAGSSYPVTLYFVEQYWTKVGGRVFSVSANGMTVISNLDIYATAGSTNKAIERSFYVPANASGQIVLQFSASADQAKCGAIVVGAASAVDVTGSLTITRSGIVPILPGPAGGYQILTVTNTGSTSISGPVNLVLTGLPSGVTVTNPAGTFNGNPYVTATAGSLAPGASAQVRVNYSNPSNQHFTYGITAYSGTL